MLRVAIGGVLTIITALPVTAQHATVRDTPGSGATFVCLSGLLGGTAGFDRLARELNTRGHRVIRIDAYARSIDSVDVTFEALARRVDRLLDSLGIDSAVVIGHAHGAGVALRLAAHAPHRVRELWFLDAGALASARTRVFSSSLRFLPIISKLPGGRRFIRGRIVGGLRENSVSHSWLDTGTVRAYTDPLLRNVSRVVGLASRLASQPEPGSIADLISRIRVPVGVVLGSAPHPSAPIDGEVAALGALGDRVRIARLPGVAHFPHEEATAAVAALILKPNGDPPSALPAAATVVKPRALGLLHRREASAGGTARAEPRQCVGSLRPYPVLQES